MIWRYSLLVLSLTGLLVGPAQAQEFSLSPARPAAAIGTFPLNEALLEKIENVQKDLRALPEVPVLSGVSRNSSVEAIGKALAAQPQMMAVLQKNVISSYDYIAGTMALSDALAAASAAEEEKIFDETRAVSKENLAFGKKYANRIRKLLEE